MEKDQEFRHVCKFCSKSFSCGRSLGGHMRSHMVNDVSAQADGTKITKKKLPPLKSACGAQNSNAAGEATGYGLRENPKKTWRLADHSSEDASLLDKSCRECGKLFPSWKALFGHMKCHAADKERVSNDNNILEEQQESWTSTNNHKLVMDSQSDNETAAPSRKKRSKRTRYMVTANSSSLSFANNASSSVSETEQEQEEVAMCLMMLSRDVGQWGEPNSIAESSDNNSLFLENKTEGKTSTNSTSESAREKKRSDRDFTMEGRKTEFSVSTLSRQEGGSENEGGICGVESIKNMTKETGLDQAEITPNKLSTSKRRFCRSFDPELGSDSLKKLPSNALYPGDDKDSERNNRFECATCNKVFHSYQALGGHRASHKKMKSCFASRIDSSENSIETEASPDPVADTKSITNKIPVDHLATECDNEAETTPGAKKSKWHECAICLKVFPTGQALGGHKRSHLTGATESKTNQTTTSKGPIPAIRGFLDLNLPAPAEEESNGVVGFNPWWIGSNHKHEALVGLISN